MAASMTFDEFYEMAFTKGVRHLALSYGIQRQDAEEIVQHALIAFWQDHPDVSGIVKPFTYFRGYLRMHVLRVLSAHIARPVTLDVARTTPARHELPLSLDFPVGERQEAVYGDLLPSRTPSVEAVVLARLHLQEVCAHMNDLDGDQRLMLKLLMLGYDVGEIRQYLVEHYHYTGSYQAVVSRLHTARRLLREQTQTAKVQRRYARQPLGKAWSPTSACCIECGTSTIPHQSKGRCRICGSRFRQREKRAGRWVTPARFAWSLHYPACVQCGTTTTTHQGHGYCKTCYRLFIFPGRPVAVGD